MRDRPKILVVEDEVLIRMSAVDFLQDVGFDTLQANNAPDACAIFASRPDIAAVFTDIEMAGAFDGLAFAREVRAKRPDVFVLVTSGRQLPLSPALPTDCVFLPKPYSPSQVALALWGFPRGVVSH
jgi:two-component system, response regulator PdtaR